MIYLYRALWLSLSPLLFLMFIKRLKQGKEHPTRWKEKLGFSNEHRPAGKLAWIHCASVGESLSVQPLVKSLLEDDKDLHILFTTGTVSSSKMMAERLPDRAFHQFAPLDFYPFVKRFMKHWQVDVSVFVESEFWPEMLKQAHQPMLIGARVSDRSARRHAQWNLITRPLTVLLQRFELCLTQTEQDTERLKGLGVTKIKIGGNLKFDAPLPTIDNKTLKELKAQIGDRPVLVASSTHPTEETYLANIQQNLRKTLPNLLTIIAPRHPHRGDAIVQELKDNFTVAQRSKEEMITPEIEIYLADSFGEMGLWNMLSDVVFIGGSITSHGGQNPFEPLQVGATVVTGPHMYNFKRMMEIFKEMNIITQVENISELDKTLLDLLNNRESLHARREDISSAVENLGGASQLAKQEIQKLLEST